MSRRPLLVLILLAAAHPAQAQRLRYVPVSGEELTDAPRLAYQRVEGDEAPSSGTAEKARRRKLLQWALLDRAEYSAQRGGDSYAWDFSALLGGERNRLWLGSVGEGGTWQSPDYLEFAALYSRHVGGSWDLNAGLRYDMRPRPDRAYATLGAQYDDGKAWLGAFAYLSDEGELSARLAAYYNLKLVGALVLQPSFELDASGEDVPALGLGRGFTYGEAGLRLRYEIREAFAPYVGLSWSRDLGSTGRLTRAEGEDPETKSLLVGIRSSF
jgi:copper resistance protein B